MKEINVFVRHNDLSRVTYVIQKHKAGITFFDIQGTGRTPRSIPEVVHSYQTRRKTVPRFIGGILVISIVSDSTSKLIVEEILNSFGAQQEPLDVLFIKDVVDAYELGTKTSGDKVVDLQ
jgi:nitrogen regulatory protein P-II 1